MTSLKYQQKMNKMNLTYFNNTIDQVHLYFFYCVTFLFWNIDERAPLSSIFY